MIVISLLSLGVALLALMVAGFMLGLAHRMYREGSALDRCERIERERQEHWSW